MINEKITKSILTAPIVKCEIEKYTKQTKSHTHFCENGLTKHILKQTVKTISYAFIKVFNLSTFLGRYLYPSCFKKSKASSNV